MRTSQVTRTAVGRMALMLATSAAASGPVLAQYGPSLSDAISPKGRSTWSDRDAELPPPPTLLDRNPAPIPAEADDVPFDEFSAGAPCESCQGGAADGACSGYPFNRCGCSAQYFPWLTGPGNCDNWCVGPHWNVEVDGLALRRDDADWDRVVAGVGLAPDLLDQFDYGPGVRLFVTAYNDAAFGLQIGYEGINNFEAIALFPGVGAERAIEYQSNFNSVEINAVRRTNAPLKLFAGFRYIELDEDFVDGTIVDKTPPPPSDPPTSVSFTDTSDAFLLENRLIGAQLGGFRDAWRLNRWITIEPYGNAGVYINNFKRDDLEFTTTTIFNSDDLSTPADNEASTTIASTSTGVQRNFSEIAFAGEAGITGVLRINRCVALRGGYQILAINGVGEGLDAFFAPGLDPTTLVYHGARFGLEYQR